MVSGNVSLWSIFRDYLNSKPTGSIVRKLDIIDIVESSGIYGVKHCSKNVTKKSINTLNSYISFSKNCGFLHKTESNGKYIVFKHFPNEFRSVDLKKEYDNIKKNDKPDKNKQF